MKEGKSKYNRVGYAFLLFLLIVFTTFNFVRNVYALDLPHPPDTELVEGKTYQFRSLLSQGDILQFYQQKLTSEGWERIDVPFQQTPGFAFPNRTFNFTKGSDTLVLVFSPFTTEGFVFYTINSGEPPEGSGLTEVQELSPDEMLKESESLDFMPIYPKSKQINLSGASAGTYVGYMASGSIDEIKKFYLQGMPQYGWSLVGQEDINEKEYDLSEAESICPTCPKLSLQAGGRLTRAKISGVTLEFKQADKTCSVTVSKIGNVSSGVRGLTSSGLGDTIITIVYDDK